MRSVSDKSCSGEQNAPYVLMLKNTVRANRPQMTT